ncbi:MAG TPA: DUF4192 domain-containing protein [Actinotalea sp.]|nr:DUF4192 domain-containing protein [Actinotalea sp.]
METTIRTSEPRELLALIPYQLGFVPTQSAVVVSLRRARSRVGLVARVDLDDLVDVDRGPQVARSLVGHLVADGARAAVLVLYTDADLQADPRAGRTAQENLAVAAEHFLGVPDCWVVTPRGYHGLDCTDDRCCPPGGRPLADLQATQVGAHMVLTGVQVVASRAELVRTDAAPAAARRSARRAAARWRAHLEGAEGSAALHRWRRESLALWREELERVAGARLPDPNRIGRLQAALADVLVRDAAMLGFVEGSERLADRVVAGYGGPDVSRALRVIIDPVDGAAPDAGRAATSRALLGEVVAHSAPRLQAPALTLLAVLAWWAGDGARAGLLVERALAAEPGYRLAELLDQTLTAGMPPGWLRARGA